MSLTALENRRSIGGPAADLTAHNPASISDSDPIENGTYAPGHPLLNVQTLRFRDALSAAGS